MKKFLFVLMILFCSYAYADVVSLESNYVEGQTDLVSKLNNDRTDLTNGVNNVRGVFAGGVQTSGQVKSDTIGEANMADDANPRIRTAEGASCTDLVVDGFLPSTTSGTLIGSVPAGTGYPDGYRVNKDSATANTFTATKWTWIDLDTAGSFSFLEQNIDTTAPAISANSLRIARVSTDATELTNISDLRTTSCTAGPFSAISDSSGEATLEDLFENGAPVRQFSQAGITPDGMARGAFVSWDTHTQFLVTTGALEINGRYRIASSDTTVTTAVAAPATGGSGIDTGSIAASTRYYVYGVADQDSVKTYSVSFSTSGAAPTGVTNSRLIGSIVTDATSLFTSKDTVTAHAITDRELIGGWISLDGSGTVGINNSFNVSGLADGGTGLWTVTWDVDFNNVFYAVVCTAAESGASMSNCSLNAAPAVGSVVVIVEAGDNTNKDVDPVTVIAVGDTRS